jgi:serine protease AprX
MLRVAPLSISAAPNPFSDRTTLSYRLSADAKVNLEVATPVGRRITTLVNDQQKTGDHDVSFDGSRLATGVYVATLTVTTKGGERQTASVQLTITR